MKKFTDLNNTDNSNKVENSKTKKELIGNIIEESLKIENGVIVGKDILVDTFNRMIELNDHKTTIKVLESVKVLSHKSGFNFKLINEAIENEKILMNKPITVEDEVVNENNVVSELKKAAKKTGIKFSVKMEDVDKELKSGTYGENIKKLVDELSSATTKVENEIKKECEDGECEVKESVNILTESAETTQLLSILLGTGGLFLTSVGISTLLTALESGKLGEKGKKIAHGLSNLGAVVNSGVDRGEYKEEKEVKESLLLDNYTDEFITELNSLNSIYESIKSKK